jgi:predicted acyltransferase
MLTCHAIQKSAQKMKTTTTRFTALDVFRGLTVCFMIIVISPGSGAIPYRQLDHAAWHGFTVTDLVFPSFLFAVGNALSFSENKFRPLSSYTALFSILKRAIIIFILGYLLCWFPFFRLTGDNTIISYPISDTRIFGVLQRIAICYLLTALAVRYIDRKLLIYLAIAILLVYWLILVVFGSADPFSLEGNAILKLDLLLFGPAHLYYDHGTFDPEGLLSTIPAVVNTLAGYLAGKHLQEKGTSPIVLRPLIAIGLAGIAIALLWNTVFPINKKIWSGSFALLTISIDLILLSLLVFITKNQKDQQKSWIRFFTIFGKNPLFIYLMAEMLLVVLHKIPYHSSHLYEKINNAVFQYAIPGPAGSLLFALTVMAFCWSVGWILNKNKIYVKV